MSPRVAFWVLWTALSLCLPGAARFELCLCDGIAGLFDGAACGRAQAADAPQCCGLDATTGEDRIERSGDAGAACACLQLEVRRGEPAVLSVSAPVAALACAPAPDHAHAAPSRSPGPGSPCARVCVRSRAPDGVPLRI